MYIGSDVVDMKTNAEDPIYTGKKDTGEYNIKMPKKQVLPSSTQVPFTVARQWKWKINYRFMGFNWFYAHAYECLCCCFV